MIPSTQDLRITMMKFLKIVFWATGTIKFLLHLKIKSEYNYNLVKAPKR